VRPVRQPDGKVLVPARVERWAGSYSFEQVALARFTRRGALDKTFGRRGRVLIGFHWGSSPVGFSPVTVSVQADGRILLAGSVSWLLSLHAQLAIVRLLPDGSRDPAFGANGVVVWNPPWRADTLSMTTLPGVFVPQADGRVLAAGVAEETRGASKGQPPQTSVRRIAFVRFHRDGSVDQSFGRDGVVEESEGPDYWWSWAVLPDGHVAALSSRNEGFGGTACGSTVSPPAEPSTKGSGRPGRCSSG
jgi:uncharacterized delta-60 repeat protein